MKSKSLIGEMIGLLDRTGADELAELDQLIADRETALEAYCKTKRDEINALQQIRKVCDVKLNGRKAKPETDEPAPVSNGIPTLADWIAQRIEERGPQTTAQLAAAKAIGESQIKQSIGRSKGRFVWDADDETWTLNE